MITKPKKKNGGNLKEVISREEDIVIHASGAKSSQSLPMYDNLPLTFLTRTAERFTLGAKKYGKYNYRRGLNDKTFILDRLNHAFLHLKLAIDAIEGGEITEDDNLSAVSVNIAMAMEYEAANGLTPPKS